ncbi:TnsD family Tn7-like transposition protein [Halomonas vilamensis]|uniref:TnsD family Tn7-like transposition protein n=1 Tax=Vreelandella vilamensis TaxID=531309 RepID=A0ABU1H5S0_9GAMM|nr:TnsD family Tn7-like transposition protein [Halomonas vilamensis]MDR5899455.1 TnsD family Tn7-like transposition protein [Halomonas vilamensis]
MLMQFPVAHRDELLGSVIARFIYRQGIEEDKVALSQLFGSQKILASCFLQGHATQLLCRIGHLWPVQERELLEAHTILPLFKPFVENSIYKRLIRDLSESGKNNSSLRTGFNASNLVYPAYYKICPLCWKSQRENYGYSFWQRLFQCPGVEACPVHGCLLIDTEVKTQSTSRHKFVGTHAIELKVPEVLEPADEKNIKFSILVSDLLGLGKETAPTRVQWSRFYRNLARRKGLTYRKGINHEEVAKYVDGFWKKEWLEKNGLTLKGNDNWLINIFRKHRRSFSYLQHFTCWLALSPDKIRLNQVLNEAACLSNNSYQKVVYFSSAAENRCHEYRSKWLDFLKQYSYLRDIRKQREGASVYSWLYRFDSEWLEHHKPAKKKKMHRARIDWAKRDRSIVRELLSIERSVWLGLEGPRRSRSWYCKQVTRSCLERKLDKLPLCRAFFVRYTETVDEFQARRLACIFSQCILNGRGRIPVYELERMVGLKPQTCRDVGRQILERDIRGWQADEKVAFWSPTTKS